MAITGFTIQGFNSPQVKASQMTEKGPNETSAGTSGESSLGVTLSIGQGLNSKKPLSIKSDDKSVKVIGVEFFWMIVSQS